LGEYSQDTTIPDEEMTQYLESVLATLKSHRAEIENLIKVCLSMIEREREREEEEEEEEEEEGFIRMLVEGDYAHTHTHTDTHTHTHTHTHTTQTHAHTHTCHTHTQTRDNCCDQYMVFLRDTWNEHLQLR